MTLPKVLLVEDDLGSAEAFTYALRNSYDITCVHTAEDALNKTKTNQFDIIVLDLNLPDWSGIFVCQQLKDRGLRTPILILSGDDSTHTKIKLLDAGAADYLTKPFVLGELKARLRVLLRNAHALGMPDNDMPREILGIKLDRHSFTAELEGHTISLRRKEFDILDHLLQNAGRVVSRESLIHSLWNSNDDEWNNTISVHINALRDKIDRPYGGHLIQTIHGRGYKLDISGESFTTIEA
ncbi:MAG: response regulator transcription factor [Candidatus Saccharimonadales bacterium]